jgi:transcriptional regulator with XRE-family HTH domain
MLIEDTTKAERLYLWRHRRNVPRHVAASDLGTDVDTYAEWEDGRREIQTDDTAFAVLVDGILPREHFLLLRKRAGLTLSQVARMLGVGKQHISKMERGIKGIDPLRAFWGQA